MSKFKLLFSSCLFVLLWSTGSLSAQAPTISVSSDATSVLFGDSFEVTVTRTWATQFQAPDFDSDDLSLPHADLVNEKTQRGNEIVTVTQIFRCYAFRHQAITIPILILSVEDASSGARLEAESEALTLVVRTILPADDAGDLELPRDLIVGLGHKKHNLFWPMAILVSLTISALFWVRARRWRTDLEQWSLSRTQEELDVLQGDLPLESAVFYRRLVATLREYLGGAQEVSAGEMNSQDLYLALTPLFHGDHERSSALESLLDRCDRAIWGDDVFSSAIQKEDLDTVKLILLHGNAAPEVTIEGGHHG